ncbi:TetR/AcrR family transcriptional regulator [Leifsonia poae]|uniref:TetR/AcrR family transcriptional regulator n=1 Tax=Leifsonia poae TaxID=110933 RepID=UPI003D665A72
MLAAARQKFATAGFGGATLRSIATRTGVDVALLSHYIGNKDSLFAATLELPDSIREAFIAALTGPSPGRATDRPLTTPSITTEWAWRWQ